MNKPSIRSRTLYILPALILLLEMVNMGISRGLFNIWGLIFASFFADALYIALRVIQVNLVEVRSR